jgi:plasmid stabilization system protein ParE
VTCTVRLSRAAERDLPRLAAFLVSRASNIDAARRAVEAIVTAVESLGDFPERGRPGVGPFRELPVSFGRYGYVVRYQIRSDEVLVTRIFHVREGR